MSPALNNSPNRLEQIVADNRNIYGSGNEFILPVIPVRGFQQQFWERYYFPSIIVGKIAEKARVLQLLIVLQLIHGLIVLFRSVAPQRPDTVKWCDRSVCQGSAG